MSDEALHEKRVQAALEQMRRDRSRSVRAHERMLAPTLSLGLATLAVPTLIFPMIGIRQDFNDAVEPFAVVAGILLLTAFAYCLIRVIKAGTFSSILSDIQEVDPAAIQEARGHLEEGTPVEAPSKKRLRKRGLV